MSKLDKLNMDMAITLAKYSTCTRLDVGCVVTDANGYILSTGYNGAPSGHEHCSEHNCTFQETCDAVHAEQNAIARLHSQGHTLYCTVKPCRACQKLIAAAGIHRVVYMLDTKSPHYFPLNFKMEQYNVKS